MDAETLLRTAWVVLALFALPFTLLRTALVVLSLFGLPLLALGRLSRREETPPADEESASRGSRGGATPRYRTWRL
jgi:hypothetical protein